MALPERLERWIPYLRLKFAMGYGANMCNAITPFGRLLLEQRPSHAKRGRRGKPGRRGYSLKVLEYALALRKKHRMMKATAIRAECHKKFPAEPLPANGPAFRAWMNRPRTNRTN
jgi:hypothetical protein